MQSYFKLKRVRNLKRTGPFFDMLRRNRPETKRDERSIGWLALGRSLCRNFEEKHFPKLCNILCRYCNTRLQHPSAEDCVRNTNGQGQADSQT